MPDDPLYRFPAALDSLAAMVAHLQSRAHRCGGTTLLRAETALEELLTNSIVHGQAALSPAASVWLSAVGGDDGVHLRYEDAFAPFDPMACIDEALRRTTNPMEQRPPGGLGLLMVFRLADGFDYRHVQGRNRIDLHFTDRAVAAPAARAVGGRSVDLGA